MFIHHHLLLLSPSLSILLHVDMAVGLEGVNGLVGELDTAKNSEVLHIQPGVITYVKPLMMVYSCLMVPPCFLALSLALIVG